MSEQDYLWDSHGEPAPEVEQLERILCALQWRSTELDLERASPPGRWYVRRPWLIAAASIAVLFGGMIFVQRAPAPTQAIRWQLSFAGEKSGAVVAGAIVETGNTGATMQSESVGEVRIDPHTQLRLLSSQDDRHRLALDHGTIHALIWAPPAKFVVDTAGANAVDLGCEYTLSVAKDGQGFLSVELGWVAFQWNKIESFIPQGAACTTRVGHGPDTPYFRDASQAFTTSLAAFDQTGDQAALRRVLAAARPRDALSLWHLLERTTGAQRTEVFNRFAGLVNLPAGVTREAVLNNNRKSMDAAWDALNLGDTGWWREWRRDW